MDPRRILTGKVQESEEEEYEEEDMLSSDDNTVPLLQLVKRA